MGDLRDANILVQLLDQQFDYLLGHERHRRLLLVPRLLRFVERDPHLAGIVADMRAEADAELRELELEDGALRERLHSIWEQHRAQILRLLEDDLRDDDNHRKINSYCTLDAYEAATKERSPLLFGGMLPRSDREGGTTALIRALSHWTTWAMQTATENSAGTSFSGLEGLPSELEDLKALRLHHLRRYNQAAQTMAGPAYDRLVRIRERLNPPPPKEDADPTKRIIDWATFQEAEKFAERVHGGVPHDNVVVQDDLDVVCNQVAEDAALLLDELRSRVLLGRSRLALVQRFAARSEAFDAARLRDLAAGDTRNAERLLTLDFARYLFDQGLTPLLDPTIGSLRPDILDLTSSDLFYVEAKQYADASPKSALVRAYGQVWGTWGRLRNQFTVPEAFLVVFRRSGPRVELPPLIRFRGLRLYSVLADLDKDSGSAEKYQPISISEDELLPRDDAQDSEHV